jgi:spore maturation protein CgeB
MIKSRILLVGTFRQAALEKSYYAAFNELKCQVEAFDIADSIKEQCRLGNMGRFFNKFIPVEPWIRKANRELVLVARRFRPDIVIIFGQNQVRAGSLAQIRSNLAVKMVLIWPDTLVNFNDETIITLPLYDLVASYGREAIAPLRQLGANHVEWIPLAGDPHMHLINSFSETDKQKYEADISFVGGWRPEREATIQIVLAAFQNKKVTIWGPDWGRYCRGKKDILKSWQGRSLYEKDFAKAIALSRISLNIIDDTNYPAANMRFFEIPMAGGLQLCSPCPEMENDFKHGETLFYYKDADELVEIIRSLLANDSLRMRVAKSAQEKVLGEHTYVHRARKILELLQ